MAQFVKLLLSFAPWIAFLIIAPGGMLRLKIGVAVALALSVVMGLLRLHRGVILWVGLAFFTYATVAVIVFEHMWTVRFMGVLANGALALGTWATVGMKKPFTLDYAKDHTDPALWNHPAFIRSNMIIASAWGACFTINAGLALYASLTPDFPALTRELASYTVMLLALFFTTWYPNHARRQRLAAEAKGK